VSNDGATELVDWFSGVLDAEQARLSALPHGPWTITTPDRGYPQTITNPQAMLLAQTFIDPAVSADVALHIVAHSPDRELARVEAFRHMVTRFRAALKQRRSRNLEQTLLVLLEQIRVQAACYAHYPGYRLEWRMDLGRPVRW
jgi:hypothetical protein